MWTNLSVISRLHMAIEYKYHGSRILWQGTFLMNVFYKDGINTVLRLINL